MWGVLRGVVPTNTHQQQHTTKVSPKLVGNGVAKVGHNRPVFLSRVARHAPIQFRRCSVFSSSAFDGSSLFVQPFLGVTRSQKPPPWSMCCGEGLGQARVHGGVLRPWQGNVRIHPVHGYHRAVLRCWPMGCPFSSAQLVVDTILGRNGSVVLGVPTLMRLGGNQEGAPFHELSGRHGRTHFVVLVAKKPILAPIP